MDYDVIIAGGGPAGIGAAYAAAEAGAKILLVERYGRLGGTAIHSLVGPLMGGVESRIVREVTQALGGCTVDFQKADLQLYDLLTAKGVEILLHATVVDVLREAGRLNGVVLNCREGNRSLTARTVIDATGDGEVAFRAGVPFETGRESDGLTQPMSIMYTIGNIDPARRFLCCSEEQARQVMVDGRTWEEIVMEARCRGELPESVGVIRLYTARRADENIVNATQVNFLNGLLSSDLTKAEIEGRRQAFGILEFLRRTLPGYENACISGMPAAIGVRETRRFEGMARLEKENCLQGTRFSDAIVRRAAFPIDIHNPAGCGQAAGHDENEVGTAERGKPYDIPYGVLVPRRLNGLLLAGRCISASHEALASCRVMCIAMALGAAAGAAAAYASRHNCEVRDVPPAELAPLLFDRE